MRGVRTAAGDLPDIEAAVDMQAVAVVADIAAVEVAVAFAEAAVGIRRIAEDKREPAGIAAEAHSLRA